MRHTEIAATLAVVLSTLVVPGIALVWLMNKPACLAPCGVDLRASARTTLVTTLGAPLLADRLGR